MTQNGNVMSQEIPTNVGVTATPEDLEELFKSNPNLQLALVNIIQKRMLAERDAEIAELRKEK